MREDVRYIFGRCPVCYIDSPICDQQEDIRRTVISEWWHAHFDKVHRFGPAFFRADPPAQFDGEELGRGLIAHNDGCREGYDHEAGKDGRCLWCGKTLVNDGSLDA
jgi:hypothetical protein